MVSETPRNQIDETSAPCPMPAAAEGGEKWTPGEVFSAPYPFVRDTYESLEEDGPVKALTWRPGVRHELVLPDDSEAVADGLGRIILTVVSAHKPGRFPERVFFTRRWQTPSGRTFGKGALHIATAEKFRRLTRGYRHEFRLVEGAQP